MWAVARVSPGPWGAGGGRAGLALAVGGGALTAWAVFAFRRASTTIHPLKPSEASSLVVAGPNRWSRNPMYLGMLLVLTGWGLWLGGGISLLGVAAAWAWLRWLQIAPEERALAARFGGDYARYCARVRRWA